MQRNVAKETDSPQGRDGQAAKEPFSPLSLKSIQNSSFIILYMFEVKMKDYYDLSRVATVKGKHLENENGIISFNTHEIVWKIGKYQGKARKYCSGK